MFTEFEELKKATDNVVGIAAILDIDGLIAMRNTLIGALIEVEEQMHEIGHIDCNDEGGCVMLDADGNRRDFARVSDALDTLVESMQE